MGRELGNGYMKIMVIGEGAYGKVYEVEKDGQRYAAKQVDSVDLNELDLMMRFDHPNVNKCLDFFQLNNGKFVIVMPLAESDLSEFIDQRDIETRLSNPVTLSNPSISMRSVSAASPSSISTGSTASTDQMSIMYGGNDTSRPQLSYQHAMTICHQIASALHFLHQQKYYHCDLKEQNVLITKEGNAILSDFGLAYPSEYNQPFCGTPTKTAPEGLVNRHYPSPSSGYYKYFTQEKNYPQIDIFSLGLLFVYILTGQKLILVQQGMYISTAYNTFFNQQNNRIDKLPVSQEWKDLIQQMVEPDTTKRLRTISEVLRHTVFVNAGLSIPISGRTISPQVHRRCQIDAENNAQLNKLLQWINNVCLENWENIAIAFTSVELIYRYLDTQPFNSQNMVKVATCCGIMGTRVFGELDDLEDATRFWLSKCIKHWGKSIDEDDIVTTLNELIMLFDGRFRSLMSYDFATSKKEIQMALLFHSSCIAYRLFSPDYFHQEFLSFEPSVPLSNLDLFQTISTYFSRLSLLTEHDWKLLGPYLGIQVVIQQQPSTIQPRIERLMREHSEMNVSASDLKERIDQLLNTQAPVIVETEQDESKEIQAQPEQVSETPSRDFIGELETLCKNSEYQEYFRSSLFEDDELHKFFSNMIRNGGKVDPRFVQLVKCIQSLPSYLSHKSKPKPKRDFLKEIDDLDLKKLGVKGYQKLVEEDDPELGKFILAEYKKMSEGEYVDPRFRNFVNQYMIHIATGGSKKSSKKSSMYKRRNEATSKKKSMYKRQ